jgi:hypothetical protein
MASWLGSRFGIALGSYDDHEIDILRHYQKYILFHLTYLHLYNVLSIYIVQKFNYNYSYLEQLYKNSTRSTVRASHTTTATNPTTHPQPS